MSSFDPSSTQEPLNPYAAPLADLGAVESERAVDDSEAEIIRRLYLGHEDAVKSIGSLHHLGAFFGMIAVIGMVVEFATSLRGEAWLLELEGVAIYIVMTGMNYSLGYGLCHLQIWARWTETVFLMFGVLSTFVLMIGLFATNHSGIAIPCVFGIMICAYVLYLLLSPKGAMVFSPGYKAIIKKTPHMTYKSSRIVKIVVVFFLGLIVLTLIFGVIGAVIGDTK